MQVQREREKERKCERSKPKFKIILLVEEALH